MGASEGLRDLLWRMGLGCRDWGRRVESLEVPAETIEGRWRTIPEEMENF